MKRTISLICSTALTVLIVTLTPPALATAPDPAYPVGNFRVDDDTIYLTDPASEAEPFAYTYLRQISVSDDNTASAQITREVDADHGAGYQLWIEADQTSQLIGWETVGTYHPRVRLTDVDGHQTVITFEVTVAKDLEPPYVLIDQPRPALRHRVAGWRTLRGLAIDQQTPIYYLDVSAIERRHGRWYIYNFKSKTWFRTRPSMTRAGMLEKARYTYWSVSPKITDGRWTTPVLRKLTKGHLLIVVDAGDEAPRSTRVIRDVQLTRR